MTEQTTLLENDIARLSENIAEQYAIDAHYFEDQSIKRGLRNADGTGVLIGVSKVGSVQESLYVAPDGAKKAFPWRLCPAQRIEIFMTAGGSHTSTTVARQRRDG